VGNRDILERNVEFLSTAEEVGANAVGDRFSLRNEFGCIELGYNGF
jgi:hypothetical protein